MADTDALVIEREEGPSKGRYVVRLDRSEAQMTYSRAGAGLIIIDHTEVPQALRGRGIGEAMVARGVADARREGKKVVPLCPYARAQIMKHPEWQDVLDR